MPFKMRTDLCCCPDYPDKQHMDLIRVHGFMIGDIIKGFKLVPKGHSTHSVYFHRDKNHIFVVQEVRIFPKAKQNENAIY